MNNPVLIHQGIRERRARAYESRQEWKLKRLNVWMFIFEVTYL